MDSEITLRIENWRGGDWDETQNGAHVMRRKGCAMQNQGIKQRKEDLKINALASYVMVENEDCELKSCLMYC